MLTSQTCVHCSLVNNASVMYSIDSITDITTEQCVPSFGPASVAGGWLNHLFPATAGSTGR
jgi:hypothetical protein